mmetsp:Transcript_31081/g.56545  ORF Transcript_31081/g.56545 Transcript_31081/m.56545 type:complete len:98 (-) Transcript_31081:60-353(-)
MSLSPSLSSPWRRMRNLHRPKRIVFRFLGLLKGRPLATARAFVASVDRIVASISAKARRLEREKPRLTPLVITSKGADDDLLNEICSNTLGCTVYVP